MRPEGRFTHFHNQNSCETSREVLPEEPNDPSALKTSDLPLEQDAASSRRGYRRSVAP